MMFGKEILNGKELREVLGISTTIYYQLLKNGMPFHQLTTTSKKYFNVVEVEDWLQKFGYHRQMVWTK